MTTATTMAGERVYSNKDNDKDPNGKETLTSFIDTTTNLWLDAFLAGRGVISTLMMTATTTATTTTKTTVNTTTKTTTTTTVNEDNDEATNGEDNYDLIF